MTESESGAWPTGISAMTLFVEDVPAAKEFYTAAFGLPVQLPLHSRPGVSWSSADRGGILYLDLSPPIDPSGTIEMTRAVALLWLAKPPECASDDTGLTPTATFPRRSVTLQAEIARAGHPRAS